MKLLDMPRVRQTFEYDCGAKALQSVLAYYGIELREELIMDYARTDKMKGTLSKNMEKVLKKFGLKTITGIKSISDIEKYLDRNVPVIILLQAWNTKIKDYSKDLTDGHWVVAIGHNKEKIFFDDPYSFKTTYLGKKELEKRWHDSEKGKMIERLGIAVLGKKPRFDSRKIIHMG